MHVAAKMTSKGQITVPKAVREQLELEPGDQVVFRVEGNRATLARTPNFLDLAGVVPVPAEKRGAAWDEIRREAWRARGKRLQEQE
jgi:antitoxin PrlF